VSDFPGTEDEAVRFIVSRFCEFHRVQRAGTLPALRGEHAKAYGCVRAVFAVAVDVPPSMRHGIFTRPGARYRAWIRFSASKPVPRPDYMPAAHGMAIKLIDVHGAGAGGPTTQDFVLSSARVFPVGDAIDYAALVPTQDPRPGRPARVAKALLPPHSHWREMLLDQLTLARPPIANPLTIRYWSQTPYRLGGALEVKYLARPRVPASWLRRAFNHDTIEAVRPRNIVKLLTRDPAIDDYLEDVMAQQLAPADGKSATTPRAAFDFQVQVRTRPATMPLDDPRVAWSEGASPFHTVARIEIPAQDFGTPRRRAFGENLSFTPAHALPEHAPLGSINRVRCAVYDAISELRHEVNGVERVEPTADDWLAQAQ
jgi:Catalase